MKNVFLLIASLLVVVGCSSDDEKVTNLEVTKNNLKGKWYYSELILEDGSITPFSKACNTNRDYIEIAESGTIDYNVYYSNCTIYSQQACTEFALMDAIILNCDDKFNGLVTILTNEKLRIDYGSAQSVWYSPNNYGNFKGLILTRN